MNCTEDKIYADAIYKAFGLGGKQKVTCLDRLELYLKSKK